MAIIAKSLRKYYPYLLALSIILILAGDRIEFNRAKSISPLLAERSALNDDHAHDEGSGGEHVDHNDPVNQKRMGVYHYNEGNKFLHKGNFQEAIVNYKMALRHDPDNASFYINLSTAYMKEQKFDKAQETLMTLEGKAPKHLLLHYNLACYYSLINDTDASKKSLEQGAALGFKNFKNIQTDPDLANLRNTSGFQKWLNNLKQQTDIL